jgi:hypothetical protein
MCLTFFRVIISAVRHDDFSKYGCESWSFILTRVYGHFTTDLETHLVFYVVTPYRLIGENQ